MITVWFTIYFHYGQRLHVKMNVNFGRTLAGGPSALVIHDELFVYEQKSLTVKFTEEKEKC